MICLNSNINITEIILKTINSLLESLFSSIDNNVYNILDDIIFLDSDFLKDKTFESIFGTSVSNGILYIVNAFLFGFVLYYLFRLLLSHFTYLPIENPYQFIFKLLIVSICINSSFFICEQLLTFTSLFSSSIRELGELLFHKNICFSQLVKELNSTIYIENSSFNIFSFDGIIKSFISISLLNLVFSYSFRYILLKILLLFSPFAIATLLNNSTSWFFKTWFRSILSLLCIQILVAMALLIVLSTSYENNNIISKFIYIGSLYVLIRANSIIKELLGGLSTTISQSVNNFGAFLKK